MKILYLSESYIPSKSANSIHVAKMCNAMVELGHQVGLIGIANNNMKVANIYEYFGISDKIDLHLITPTKVRYVNQIINGLKIRQIVNREKPDLLIGRSSAGFYFCSNLGIPYIFESHEPTLNKDIHLNGKFFKVLMLNRILKSKYIKSFVLISEELKKLFNLSKFPNLKVIVAHDGADSYNLTVKSELQGDKNKINLGYLGMFYKGRGIDLLIKLANEIQDIQLHLIGGDLADLHKYYPEITPSTNVYFYKFVDPASVYKYRNSLDILLAPYQDGINIESGINTTKYMSPIKIFEYMSSGKAIISSDFKVLREVLSDSNSILVSPNNLEEWIMAINQLMNKDKREELGMNALTDFNNKYSWKQRAFDIINNSLDN